MSDMWMWSDDGQYYRGNNAQSKEAVIQEAIIENQYSSGEIIFISEMKKINPPKFENILSAGRLVETANEYLWDSSHAPPKHPRSA